MTFRPGTTIVEREVLHGRVWLEHPVRVVSDDGGVLAVLIEDGCPFTFHDHPFGPHPWADRAAWVGPSVLMLHRDDDWYSVWRFFDGDRPLFWYVNFDAPLVRQDGIDEGIDTNDLQLDLVVEPNGSWHWKDVEHLGPCLASGRIDAHELRHVLDAAADVAYRLDRDDRWWAPWDGWRPPAPAPAEA